MSDETFEWSEAVRKRDAEIAALRQRVGELRFGMELVIEKAKYDEYGSFEDVRSRIVAKCQEILDADERVLAEEQKE